MQYTLINYLKFYLDGMNKIIINKIKSLLSKFKINTLLFYSLFSIRNYKNYSILRLQ